jgi:hypothetical protein
LAKSRKTLKLEHFLKFGVSKTGFTTPFLGMCQNRAKPQFSDYFSSKFDFTGGFLGSFSEKLKKGRPNQHQEKCPNPAQICSRFTCHFLDFFGGLARGPKNSENGGNLAAEIGTKPKIHLFRYTNAPVHLGGLFLKWGLPI